MPPTNSLLYQLSKDFLLGLNSGTLGTVWNLWVTTYARLSLWHLEARLSMDTLDHHFMESVAVFSDSYMQEKNNLKGAGIKPGTHAHQATTLTIAPRPPGQPRERCSQCHLLEKKTSYLESWNFSSLTSSSCTHSTVVIFLFSGGKNWT